MRSAALTRRLLWLLPLMRIPAHAQEPPPANFTVEDIQVQGLQRVSEGTLLHYVPVNIGDELNSMKIREVIKAIFGSSFFRDVELRRDGNTLIVAVLERSSLESVEIKGNKDIKTEDLQKSLRQVGLSAGKTFNRSTLEEVTQYLTDQYYSRGKYAVWIDTKVEDLPNNRVRVNIDIKEGGRARIRQINIVGNTKFKPKDILETLTLKTPTWTSWYKQDDRYSRESLQGDLEKIKTWYQDRGYANFRADSVQVAMSPEKSDIFITVNITEGEVYKIGSVKLAGNTVVPEAQLQRLLLVAPGQTYSQKTITATQELIKNRLGAEGFYFARVEPVPASDEAKKTVDLTLFVDPGNRVYVHEIAFTGSNRSNDETLRREMRQLEGALLSNIAIERSKQRLQRLSFVEEVEVDTAPVSGSPDLVDVTFKVKERPSAQIGGGIGYSASQKFMLNGNFSDSNFMGTGDAVSLQIDAGRYNQIYSFGHTNPYVSVDGLSRSVSLSYRDSTQFVSESSDFRARNLGLGLTYGWPISEQQVFRLGASLQHLELSTRSDSSSQLWQWVRRNGGSRYLRRSGDYSVRTSISDLMEINASWIFESRDRTLFATQGTAQSLSVSATVPGSELNYLTATYRFQHYFNIPLPVLREVPLRFSTTLGYGTAFGNTDSLPPNRVWFVGGPDSVRGFRESTLGPRDSLGNSYGGDTALYGSGEAVLPMPDKWQTSARVSLFYDFGQAFFLGKTQFREKSGLLADTSLDLRRLRTSTGIAVEWLAPMMGLFRFSYAIPLSWQGETDRLHGDQREGFQFSIGNAF
jgi:outer membrane protein insertion porin family